MRYVMISLLFHFLTWSLAFPRSRQLTQVRLGPALPPTRRDPVAACSYFLVFTSYFPLIPPSAFLILAFLNPSRPMLKPFLTANCRYLAMLNSAVDSNFLAPHVP